MELAQVNWDDQSKLFLKFQKGTEDRPLIHSSSVKSVNLRYSFLKGKNRDACVSSEPCLIAVNDIRFTDTEVGVAVELDEMPNVDDVRIKIEELTILLKSGDKLIVDINETYPLAEILVNDACYLDFAENIQEENASTEITIKQENSITIKTTNAPRKKKNPITQKNPKLLPMKEIGLQSTAENSGETRLITLSSDEYEEWEKLKGTKNWTTIMCSVREGFVRLSTLEQELKQANAVLREIALKNASALVSPNLTYNGVQMPMTPLPPPIPPSAHLNPPDVQTTAKVPKRILSSSPKALSECLSAVPPAELSNLNAVIKEMKEKFQNIANVKDILVKVPLEDLTRAIPRTDRTAFAKFKEKQLVSKL